MKHFYSLKRVHLPAILEYLNDFAENEQGKIIHWQIVPMKLESVFVKPSRALYTCIIEFETTETDKGHE